jgi:pimeloyl-ACP methyl ester carboxylesterase
MDAVSIAKKVFWGLIATGGVWVGCVLFCTRTWVQRQVFYAYKVPIWWGQQLDKPETFGFLKNQVTPFYIPTKDGHRLYSWLVTPLKVYAKHESTLLKNPTRLFGDVRERAAFNLLSSDPSSRLIIYFHGNAGTVGQTRRTDAYRMISSGASDSIYVLAFDYRGFGNSTGSPTEETLIKDTIEVIQWAIEVANVSASRIVLVAQSLGTALACAAASHFIDKEPKVELAGIVLCATFTDAATVFLNYSIGGYVPILAPLRVSKTLSTWFARRMTDTWKSADRIVNIVRKSSRLRLTFVHATSDSVVPWSQADQLFHLAVNALEDEILSTQVIAERKRTIDLGEGGWTHSWGDDQKLVQEVIVKHGGELEC